jgi:site-specific recombinase XerD
MLENGYQTGLQLPDAAIEKGLTPSEFEAHFEFYLRVYCYTQAPKTLSGKRDVARLLVEYARRHDFTRIGREELTAFIRHAQFGHLEPDGRWGRGAEHPRYLHPTRPRTPQLYFDYLKAFFETVVADGHLKISPLVGLKRPRCPREEIVPFSREQAAALLEAARRGRCPARDVALFTLMFDSGLRLEEVCAIKRGDIDFQGHSLTVIGKREKRRLVAFGDEAAKSLLNYHRASSDTLGEGDLLFRCSRKNKGQALTTRGVYQLFRRHGRAAGLQNVRCSPHTMRHTFATEFMLAGASQRSAMRQMGHETGDMTLKYQHVVDAQMSIIHRTASPADNLRKSHPARAGLPVERADPTVFSRGGRPRLPLESFVCSCGNCPDDPKKSCARGRVIIQRQRPEKR